MSIATIGSIAAVVVSITGAASTWIKVWRDRKDGIANAQMNDARLTIDAVQLVLAAKDSMIAQLQDDNRYLRERLHQLEK